MQNYKLHSSWSYESAREKSITIAMLPLSYVFLWSATERAFEFDFMASFYLS